MPVRPHRHFFFPFFLCRRMHLVYLWTFFACILILSSSSLVGLADGIPSGYDGASSSSFSVCCCLHDDFVIPFRFSLFLLPFHRVAGVLFFFFFFAVAWVKHVWIDSCVE